MKRFLSIVEVLTLLGMITVVFSLFLAWQRVDVSTLSAVPLPAVYRSDLILTRNGFASSAMWPIIICGTVSGLLILFPNNAVTRLPLAVVQTLLGAACTIIPLSRFAPLPGVLVCLLGGALLVAGGIYRLREAT